MAALISKELRQMLRDRVLLIFVLIGPVIQLTLLGQAVSRDIANIPIAVVDDDKSLLSRQIITALDNTEEMRVVAFPSNQDEATKLIDHGEVLGVVVIPPHFMADTRTRSAVPQIQVILDGGDSSFAATRALEASQGAVQSLAEGFQVTSSSYTGIDVETEAIFNRALDLRPHAIPSQLALITFQITTLVAVMGIVREREIGTIEMLTITPLKRLELIAGKAITPLLIGMVDFLVLFAVTQVVFGIPMRGSFLLLAAVTIVYLFCEIGYALMLSTITRTQQQAVTLVFVWAMVAITMSGYLVPVNRLPPALQWVSWLVPLRHYLAVLRIVMLKGGGILEVLPSVTAVGILTIGMLFITTRTLSRVIE